MDEKWQQLKDWINESDNIVFFGGAGVSTESGIPDFRSVDGLYNQKYKYPPEQIISHSFYIQNPEEFYRFYKDRMLFPDAKPNAAIHVQRLCQVTRKLHLWFTADCILQTVQNTMICVMHWKSCS